MRDNRTYLQAATQEIPIKNLNIVATEHWLINSVIVTVILSTNVFLLKSILNDVENPFDHLSLLGDNRVLVSFDSLEKSSAFLDMKDHFKDFF